jgi:copper amine oxidase-like protein
VGAELDALNGEVLVTHPLDPLSADEIRQAAAVVRRDCGVGGRWRFASIELKEPAKADLPALESGELARRDALVPCSLPDGVVGCWSAGSATVSLTVRAARPSAAVAAAEVLAPDLTNSGRAEVTVRPAGRDPWSPGAMTAGPASRRTAEPRGQGPVWMYGAQCSGGISGDSSSRARTAARSAAAALSALGGGSPAARASSWS